MHSTRQSIEKFKLSPSNALKASETPNINHLKALKTKQVDPPRKLMLLEQDVSSSIELKINNEL